MIYAVIGSWRCWHCQTWESPCGVGLQYKQKVVTPVPSMPLLLHWVYLARPCASVCIGFPGRSPWPQIFQTDAKIGLWGNFKQKLHMLLAQWYNLQHIKVDFIWLGQCSQVKCLPHKLVVSFSVFSFLIMETVSLTEPGIHWLVRLASQWVPGTLPISASQGLYSGLSCSLSASLQPNQRTSHNSSDSSQMSRPQFTFENGCAGGQMGLTTAVH